MTRTYYENDIEWPRIFEKRYKVPKGFMNPSGFFKDPVFKVMYATGLVFAAEISGKLDEIKDLNAIRIEKVTCDPFQATDSEKRRALGVARCLIKEPPIYCLDRALLKKFRNTSPPPLLAPPLNSFVLCLDLKDQPENDIEECTAFVSSFGDHVLITCIAGLTNVVDFVLSSYMLECDKVHDDYFAALLAHTIAYMNTYVEAIDVGEQATTETSGVGFSRKSKPKQLFLPRMISATQKTRYVRKPQASDKPKRNSPATHWRRGHWHKYLVGAGKKEEKLKWIEPILVCSE